MKKTHQNQIRPARELLSQPQTLFPVTFSIALEPALITLKMF